jgi:hypothetical protein
MLTTFALRHHMSKNNHKFDEVLVFNTDIYKHITIININFRVTSK